jgi:ABC-type transporter Mla MlaB component
MNDAIRNRRTGLVYYIHDESAAFRFRLAGDLSQIDVVELEQARQTASSIIGERALVIDLTGLVSIDSAGRELLQQWHSRGARLIVNSARALARIEGLTGLAVTVVPTLRKSGRFVPSRAAMVWLAALSGLLLVPTRASAGMSAFAAMAATRQEYTTALRRNRINDSLELPGCDNRSTKCLHLDRML